MVILRSATFLLKLMKCSDLSMSFRDFMLCAFALLFVCLLDRLLVVFFSRVPPPSFHYHQHHQNRETLDNIDMGNGH